MEKINVSGSKFSDSETIKDVLLSGKINYWTGQMCTSFESKFAKYFNRKFGISVSTGSVALDLALKSLDLNKNDEVLVTPRSYIASASCVVSKFKTNICRC